MQFRFGPAVITLLAVSIACLPASAQTRWWWRAHYYWYDYDPTVTVVTRVNSQAELIRAQSNAVVDFAKAKKLHSEARSIDTETDSRELDNWLKKTRIRWEVAAENRMGKMNRDAIAQIERMKYLNDGKWANSRRWERLRNHPELKRTSISRGIALNFLLARLAVNALPYEFDPAASVFGTEALEELKLDPEWLSHIMLEQNDVVFSANQWNQSKIEYWPYLLRWDELKSERTAYESARKTAFEQSNESDVVSSDSVRAVQKSLAALTAAFHRSSAIRRWVQEEHRFSQFSKADRFLRNLDIEVRRLETSGDIRPLRGRNSETTKFEADNLVSLLSFMNRNGLRFAAAKPGSEFVYHNLFTLMRSLYLTYEDTDPSIQPVNLRTIAEEKLEGR